MKRRITLTDFFKPCNKKATFENVDEAYVNHECAAEEFMSNLLLLTIC